jgi:phospholipase/carboxylesterase
MLDFTSTLDRLGVAESVAYLAPQAARNTWYPRSFMDPIESNEPWLSSALATVEYVCERVAEAGIDPERTVLLGFSQGACLASEFAVRNARRYGGVVAFSGGLIGPEGTTFDYEGSLDGTPVFVGCSDRDPHIPLERVHETTAAFESVDADVDERIYEGMGHTVNEDELEAAADIVGRAVDFD